MAYPRQTLENAASGERITFRQTAAETNGLLVAVDLELPQDARVPGGLHSHPLQEERFEVVKGTMRFRLRREGIVAGPGTVVVVPPGIRHDFANAGDGHALVRVEIRPALKMEQLFETAVALAEEGRTMMKGIPKPLDLALFTREFEQEVQAVFPPLWVQRLVLAPLAWLAKRRGYATRYAAEPAADERHAIETERGGMRLGSDGVAGCLRPAGSGARQTHAPAGAVSTSPTERSL
jgi:quercetin dioxygenase-like cupin family protein